MNEIVERVARRIRYASHGTPLEKEIKGTVWIEQANAAIEAMREPTETMVAASVAEAGCAPGDEWEIFEGTEWPKRTWQAMIDAALKDGS